ncbi:hypothetical protein LguiA_028885 [Lonicera macranthoides]
MRARLVVFPIKGRNWCFSRSIDRSTLESQSLGSPSTFKDLWKKISSSNKKFTASNVEHVVDFVANKMNRAWKGLQEAPAGSLKNKFHGVGLRLLSGVKPSEIFLKSVSNEVTNVDIVFPSSLNARLVRRRLRHVALRGTILHKKYLYGSVTLLPLTSAFMVLPMPNIPFFWVLFRTYSHWRALQGSEKLLQLVSDSSENQKFFVEMGNGPKAEDDNYEKGARHSSSCSWVLKPSKELEKLLHSRDDDNGLSKCTISEICKNYDLNTMDILKYRHSL